ncbi:MAG: MFS transporter [Kiritimatiellae bacterium]|nr:MFS transporter [Kiritimatiellia bacterium]
MMPTRTRNKDLSLRHGLLSVTVSGCLAMVYGACIHSPATTQFYRSLGATEFHFGLLNGIPFLMLFMQFVSALMTNRLRRRKPAFLLLGVVARLLFVVIAFAPFWFPARRASWLLTVVMLLLAVSAAMSNLHMPLWFDWMGDLVPKRILNRYWGTKQRWMMLVSSLALLGVAGFTRVLTAPIRVVYPALVTIGVAAGVIDILLFVRVREPPNIRVRHVPTLRLLLEPFRDRQYRTVVLFSCLFAGAVMFGAAFVRLYMLKVLNLSVWATTLIFSVTGLGHFVSAGAWGRLADTYGHKPILIFCVSLKSLIVLVFALVTEQTAPFVLPLAVFFDSMLNAGNMVATNGYMLKRAPQENRSMFIAAISAAAGLARFLAAMAGGAFLVAWSRVSLSFLGRTWNNYQLLFAICFLLRVGCIPIVRRIREPRSGSPAVVLTHIFDLWPLRVLRAPLTRIARRVAK